MRIAIDGRFYGLKNTGIGRYLINLLRELGKVDKENEYWVLLNKDGFREFELPNQRWHKRLVDVSHYSFAEQIVLPIELGKIKPDLLHVPHFNVPILWWGRLVVTIHDLLWHEWRGGEATTLSTPWYWVKYGGFKLVFGAAVRRAEKVFVPSEWVKKRLSERYSGVGDKVVVTYEGVDRRLVQSSRQRRAGKVESLLKKYGLRRGEYLLYVGNVYPHKNVETLVGALKYLEKERVLAVVCGRGLFRERLERLVGKEGMGGRVKWLGYVADYELRGLYKEAGVFVFPSLSEGFGLPGLEAMACGAPVVAAKSSSLPEVLGKAAVYFSPKDEKELAEKVERVLEDEDLRGQLVKLGKERVKRFSWEEMARETLEGYGEARG